MEIKDKVAVLPRSPGIYLMKDGDGKIIYVGKAKDLKSRVSQYFGSPSGLETKVLRMVSNVADFDFIVTDTELEALVLECAQIKHYMPKYNILLKDDKNYPYLRIDVKAEYPTVRAVRKREEDGARYFGPYSGGIGEILGTVQRIFKLPKCRRQFPRDFGKERPCLNYQIQNCVGLCRGEVSVDEYRAVIDDVISLLTGKYSELERDIERRMADAAENLEFEVAAKHRDTLGALGRLRGRQKVVSAPGTDRDVIGFAEDSFGCQIDVLYIRDGRIVRKDSYPFPKEGFGRVDEGIEGFLKAFYPVKPDLPREILLPCGIGDGELVSEMLSERAGHRVQIRVPAKGELKKLTDMASRNASESLALRTTKEEAVSKTALELQKIMGLTNPPSRIEAIDISNMGGGGSVAALIVFEDGSPKKSDYKRYKIKTVEGQDDYESMREVVRRRFARYQSGDAGFDTLPDVLLLDGGKGHVGAIFPLLSEMGIDLPVFGMVKDEKHRTRGLVSTEGELSITMTSAAFTYIAKIQEETHRFAISYMHGTKRKKTVRSSLLDIDGVGPARVKSLMRHFGTISAIKSATVEELAAVKGMTRPAALAVVAHFANSGGPGGDPA